MYTGCGLPLPLSVISNVPDSEIPVTTLGSNCSLIVHVAPGARVVPQVVDCRTKSVLVRIAFAGNVSVVSPVLASVRICGELSEFTG
jgi:hypothetical protein